MTVRPPTLGGADVSGELAEATSGRALEAVTDLHVDVYGDGPAAVFIHGSFGWGLDTFPHQRSLADGYRLFFIDRRGFGRSPDADDLGWPTDVEDLTSFLDEVGPAHLVGQSYGAVVVLLVAGRHPELVNSIVAIEPVFFEAARGDPRADAMTAAQKPVFERAHQMNVQAFVAARMAVMEHTDEAIAERIEGSSEQDWRAADASRRERWPGDAPVAFEALAVASFPKVIVRGAWQAQQRAGRVMPAKAMQATAEAAARKSGAELVVFESSAHDPQMEEPDRFNDLLRRIWSRAEVGKTVRARESSDE